LSPQSRDRVGQQTPRSSYDPLGCNLMVDGFESLPRTFTALVPEAA
jgi:hypothetical protein